MTEKKQILIMRILLVAFIAISAGIAIIQKIYNFSEIASLMGVSWGALAGAFLAPFLYGLYSKKITKTAVAVGFATGIAVMMFSLIYKLTGATFMKATLSTGETLDFANSIVMGSLVMLFTLIEVPVVSALTYKLEVKKGLLDPQKVEDIFSCFNGQVVVSLKDSIGNFIKDIKK